MQYPERSPIDSDVTGGGGGRVAHRDFPPGNFWLVIGKNVARKKRLINVKCRRKWGKLKKERRKWGKTGKKWKRKDENWKGKRTERSWGLFFSYFFYFCFSLSGNQWNFFGAYQNGNFYQEKKLKSHWEKSGKVILYPPLEKFPCYTPADWSIFFKATYISNLWNNNLDLCR